MLPLCYSLMCYVFFSRDLKPENILLDDRGTFQHFIIVQRPTAVG